MNLLTEVQQERYNRNIRVKEIGIEGQEKISAARVLVIGAGGLGSPAALYLAAAGVGTLGIADGDTVALSNLQRQILHTVQDIGRPKPESAAEKIKLLNPDVKIKTYCKILSYTDIREIIQKYDFILDCTDNYKTKFSINDACIAEKKIFSHAGVCALHGQTFTINPGLSACVRCVFSSPPPESVQNAGADSGILGAAAGILGSIQAAEAIKYISGAGALLFNELLSFELSNMVFRKILIKLRPDCPACGGEIPFTSPVEKRKPANVRLNYHCENPAQDCNHH